MRFIWHWLGARELAWLRDGFQHKGRRVLFVGLSNESSAWFGIGILYSPKPKKGAADGDGTDK